MSVIIRDTDTNVIQILTKGADSAVAEVLRTVEPNLIRSQQHVDKLSVTGLRTLFLAKRILTQAEYNNWKEEYNRAAASIRDR